MQKMNKPHDCPRLCRTLNILKMGCDYYAYICIFDFFFWFKIVGYSLRHVHETRVNERLQSIEQAVYIYVYLL